MLEFIEEDYQDFDIAFSFFRPAPPTPFVQWGMDDRAYTFSDQCIDENEDGIEETCFPPDNRRLHGIACSPEAAASDRCQLNTARTFAGSFSLTEFNQPYDGGSGLSLSSPPLTAAMSNGNLQPIARALANSASHEIAHLFIGNIHTQGNLEIMTASPESVMATTDKVFVNDILFQLCEILGSSGPASRCPSNAGNGAQMDSGSPTVLAQEIAPDFDFHEPAPQPIKFDYLFRTTTGSLTVKLNDIELKKIYAPNSLISEFTPVELSVPLVLFGGQPATLSLILDETTAAERASVTVSRVRASGIKNGYFQSGNLNNWTVVSSGAGGVRVIDLDDVASPPTAVVTATSPVSEGELAKLDGTGSFDPQGDPLNYEWRQIGGEPLVNLLQPNSGSTTFTAPWVVANTTLTFQLTVDDGFDHSKPVVIDVTIQDTNSVPVADAGDDFNLKAGAPGVLDGSNTYDPDGTPLQLLSVIWDQVAGAVVLLDNPASISPTFTAPTTLGETVVFKLIASDGFETSVPSIGADSSSPDTVAVTVVDNARPVADAGMDQTKNEGSEVTLSGAASSDPDGDQLSLEWQQTGGTDVGISGSTAITPIFDAPLVASGGESLTFTLKVTDDDPINPKSDEDTVVVNVANINDPPSCHLAFPNKAVLWPPNHGLIEISIEGVMDTDDEYNDITLEITGITQDESVNGNGDGDSYPDAVIVRGLPADKVMLRAERAGDENGRVYEVSFLASDGVEDCLGLIKVEVPPNRTEDAVDDGKDYFSY